MAMKGYTPHGVRKSLMVNQCFSRLPHSSFIGIFVMFSGVCRGNHDDEKDFFILGQDKFPSLGYPNSDSCSNFAEPLFCKP